MSIGGYTVLILKYMQKERESFLRDLNTHSQTFRDLKVYEEAIEAITGKIIVEKKPENAQNVTLYNVSWPSVVIHLDSGQCDYLWRRNDSLARRGSFSCRRICGMQSMSKEKTYGWLVFRVNQKNANFNPHAHK